jgi:acyl-CoA synthetase (AMP-forming)/AMP-acid ligase II
VKLLLDQISAHVQQTPHRIAVHHQGADWTYAQIWRWACQVRDDCLTGNLQPGDRVGLILGNSVEYVVAFLGTWMAGGIPVAINPATTLRELERSLAQAEPALVVTQPEAAHWIEQSPASWPALKQILLAPASNGTREFASTHFSVSHWNAYRDTGSFESAADRPRDPDAPAQIIYTSGTSGSPKGVTLSHRNLAANAESIISYLELSSSDSMFVILPFYYSYGNSLLTTHLAVGARLILASDFVFWNRALDLMQTQQATGLAGVPSSFAMLAHKSDFLRRPWPQLRYLTCAGGGLPAPLAEQLRNALPHVDLYLMYGQTEATARLATLLPSDLPHKLGSIGRPIPGVSLDLLDENSQSVAPGEVGEIVARGENLMLGYWRDPAETARTLRPEGLRTGDLARQDTEGYFYLAGRQSDLIKSGAYRIHPLELEDALYELPEVLEAAVVGLPDSILGEVPVAFIVLKPTDSSARSTEELIAAANRQLPRYKALRELRLVPSLPKTSSGKIRRAALRDAAAPSTE